MEQCRESVESIRLPRADWRTFAWGLLLLILIAFILGNWAPLRINFFGWYLDAPRAVVFAIFFGLGMVTTWLIEIRNRRARSAEETEEETTEAEETWGQPWEEDFEDEEVLATEIPPEEFEPAPEDFTEEPVTGTETEEAEEVQPEPEEFAEAQLTDEDISADEEPEDAGAGSHFDEPREETDDPLSGEDETEGDALSEEYGFAPAEMPEADASTEDEEGISSEDNLDADEDTEQGGAGDDSADESSEEDDSRKPFWRM
jgi:uncharacterized integral membrane protein